MADPTVAPVEINRVGGIQTLHEFLQIGFRGHQEEVKMIFHQHVTMQLNSIKLDIVGEDFQEFAAVRFIPEDIPPLIPPTGNIIPSPRIFYAYARDWGQTFTIDWLLERAEYSPTGERFRYRMRWWSGGGGKKVDWRSEGMWGSSTRCRRNSRINQ